MRNTNHNFNNPYLIMNISCAYRFFESFMKAAAQKALNAGRIAEAGELYKTASGIAASRKTLTETGRADTAEVMDILNHLLTLKNAEVYYLALNMDQTGTNYQTFIRATEKTKKYLENVSKGIKKTA